MKFGFIAKHRAIWPIGLCCRLLGVSRSGFYAWFNREPSVRERTDNVLSRVIHTSFMQSDRTYGARRVWHDVLAAGHNIGRHRVERLMRQQALRARPKRRARPLSPAGGYPVIAPNILDRQFVASAPNQKWVADFTYLWTVEGWLYVAVVLDLYARRVIGWSMKPEMTSQLVIDALDRKSVV